MSMVHCLRASFWPAHNLALTWGKWVKARNYVFSTKGSEVLQSP